MSTKPTGGSAFPGEYIDQELRDALVAAHKAGEWITMQQVNAMANKIGRGMTLRDYFAGQALANGWRALYEGEGVENSYEDIARFCYEMADAMLKEREK